jgi:ribose 5-phosphate isomerase B
MKIAVGTDHAGFSLKALTIAELKSLGHEVLDLGTDSEESVDYPDYAQKVAEAVMRGEAERGVVLCGSGVGGCVAANKVPGVRAATCHDTFSAHQGVEDDDVNVLCLGARVVGEQLALEIIRAWDKARFSNAERHQRRLGKVNAIEAKYSNKPPA